MNSSPRIFKSIGNDEYRRRGEAAAAAAAVGDALGWPQENRSRRTGGGATEAAFAFSAWQRRDGGQFQSHEETIAAGEYSDDTQLSLALMRSLRRGDWWEWWTKVELPFWALYARGAGVAVKRAARSWGHGDPPWKADPERYFQAGANGVAMRVLPHCLAGVFDEDFDAIAQRVVADGISTHGHPRALVGALTFAYSTWVALRLDEPLGYGTLIRQAIEEADTWSRFPDVSDVAPDWRELADQNTGGYEALWLETVDEMRGLLGVCTRGIEQGSLPVDRGTLEELGWFDPKRGGSGTITTAAALFQASRYASRPDHGLTTAAFMRGTDTDTLAAMVGSLLGAIDGTDWLGPTARELEDHEYVRRLSGAVTAREPHSVSGTPHGSAQRLWKQLTPAIQGTELDLPDGRRGVVRLVVDHPTKTRHQITSWQVETDDGQTLHFKRARRLTTPTPSPRRADAEPTADARPARRPLIGVLLEVHDLGRSVSFYRDVIGLEITKQGTANVGFGGLLAVSAAPGPIEDRQLELPVVHELESAKKVIAVYVDRDELDGLYERATAIGAPVSPITAQGARRGFRCADPDGNVLQVRERNGS